MLDTVAERALCTVLGASEKAQRRKILVLALEAWDKLELAACKALANKQPSGTRRPPAEGLPGPAVDP